MGTKTLFNITNVEKMSQAELADTLCKWFKENGTIAFEHGYKAYITSDNIKWRLTMAVECGLEMINTTNRKHKRYQPYNSFPKRSLLKIMRICDEYYNYCLTEA